MNTTPDPAAAFLEQNELAAQTLTVEQVTGLAEYHGGGLVVLGLPLGADEDYYVKMHDSWGDDGKVVVHVYHPDGDFDPQNPDPMETEEYFDTGAEAYDRFQTLTDTP